MILNDLTDEQLQAEWQGRNTVLRIVTEHPDRLNVPALVIESLVDWAKEPATESETRLADIRAAIERFDPAPAGLADRCIDAMRAELEGNAS